MAKQLIANLVAKAWSALVSIAAVPVYVHFLGVEGYGLVGVFAVLLAVGSLLDVGLSATVTRELARDLASPGDRQYPRDLLRTCEIMFWCAASTLGALLAASAAVIGNVVQPEAVSATDAATSVALMAVALVFQVPLGLYAGVLLGRQKQVTFAIATVVMYTIRGVGAIGVLALLTPSVVAFFCWQVVASAIHTAVLAWLAWRELPSTPRRPHFNRKLIAKLWRFAAGMAAIAVSAVMLTQLDKLLLLQFVSLKDFGYYALATVCASVLSYIVAPVFAVAFPTLAAIVGSDNPSRVLERYVTITEAMSVLVVPAAAVLVLFPDVILTAWLGNPAQVEKISPLVTILAVGYALNALVVTPYALQVSYGRTRLVLMVNLAALGALVPLLIVTVSAYGAIGASLGWLLLNSGYVLVAVPLMHRNLPRGGFGKGWLKATTRPAVAAVGVVASGRLAMPSIDATAMEVAYVSAVGLAAFAAAAAAAPSTREWLRGVARRSLAWGR